MNIKELQKLITGGESEYLEFKENFSESVIETLVAFANSKGGKVIIGLKNNHEIIGINNINNETIKNRINEIKNKTYNTLIPEIEGLIVKDKNIIIITQLEYPIKPISFKGRYYRRIGSSNHIMDAFEISNEYLKTKNSSRDHFIDSKSNIEDIDFEKIKKTIEKINQRKDYPDLIDPIQFLHKYSLIEGDKLTFAAQLLFSNKDDLARTVQIGVFQNDLNIKDQFMTKNTLIEQVDEIFDYIKKHINKGTYIIGQPENISRREYPLIALREIILNLIVHRDYRGTHTQIRIFPDYIEFFNAGGLPNDYKIEDFLEGKKMSFLRNKAIAEIFKDIGEIEKFGSGLRRITKILEDYGCKYEINTDVYSFMFKIFSLDQKILLQESTQKSTQKILDIIKNNNYITIKELVLIIGITEKAIKNNLNLLKKKGLLKRIGPDKGGKWEVVKI